MGGPYVGDGEGRPYVGVGVGARLLTKGSGLTGGSGSS